MAAPRWSSTARRRLTCSQACASATSPIRGYPAVGRGRERGSGAPRGVLRAALRSGPEHPDAAYSRWTMRAIRRRRRSMQRCSRSRSGAAASRCRRNSCSGWCRPSSRTRHPSRCRTTNDLVGSFLTINGDLRKKNARHHCAATRARRRRRCSWKGAFLQLGNSQVESLVRRSPHLLLRRQGDRSAGAPRLRPRRHAAACAGARRQRRHASLHADYLGIYGNCVIIDHGLGVQSLYGHLSSIGREGRATRCTKGQELGRTGMTGPRRRRSPALHDAGRGHAGEPGRVVGSALDGRPRAAEDPRGSARGAPAAAPSIHGASDSAPLQARASHRPSGRTRGGHR